MCKRKVHTRHIRILLHVPGTCRSLGSHFYFNRIFTAFKKVEKQRNKTSSKLKMKRTGFIKSFYVEPVIFLNIFLYKTQVSIFHIFKLIYRHYSRSEYKKKQLLLEYILFFVPNVNKENKNKKL